MVTKKYLVEDTKKLVKELRGQGIDDQEIYNQLSDQYYDKESLAILINSVVTKEKIEKFKYFNFLLIGLLFVYTLVIDIFAFTNLSKETIVGFIVVMLIFNLLNFFIIYGISKYEPDVYWLCTFMAIFSLTSNLNSNFNFYNLFFKIIFPISIGILSFYLQRKLFPNLNFRKLRNDRNNTFVLTSK